MNVIAGMILATIVILYRSIGEFILTFLMKLGHNPHEDPATNAVTDSDKEQLQQRQQHLDLGQDIPESPSMTQEEITSLGIFYQKSILIIGSNRSIGHEIAVAIVVENPTQV